MKTSAAAVIMMDHVTAIAQGCFTSFYGRVPDVLLLLRGFRGSHQPPARFGRLPSGGMLTMPGTLPGLSKPGSHFPGTIPGARVPPPSILRLCLPISTSRLPCPNMVGASSLPGGWPLFPLPLPHLLTISLHCRCVLFAFLRRIKCIYSVITVWLLTIPTVPLRIALGGTVSSIAHPFLDGFVRLRACWIRVFNAHLTSPHAYKSVQPFLRCIYPLLLGGQVYLSWEPLDGFPRCFHSLIATNFCILGVPSVWQRAHSL